MKSVLVCTLFVGLALAGKVAVMQSKCDCGLTNSGRIVGGTETKANKYPWMVALTDRGFFFCGGSIISPYHVLTAAHCGESAPASDVKVIVGAHSIKGSSQRIPVAKIVIHEEWGYNVNDIAIMVTTREMQFSKSIGPICLPSAPVQPGLDNKFIKLTGWGLTTSEGSTSDVLREAELRVVPKQECGKYWWRDLDKKLCVMAVNKGACNGDSGGPLVWLDPSTNRYTQAALVSYGGVCAGPQPTVNTDVSSYVSWINRIVDTTKPGSRTCTATKKFD